MSIPGAAGRAPNRPTTSANDVAANLRDAFEHLARATRTARPTAGGVAPARLPAAERTGWIEGLTHALTDAQAITLHVTSAAITLGDLPVLDGAERPLAEGLYVAGMRALTVFAGAPQAELVAVGAILATDWSGQGAAGLADAVWRAELNQVHVDLAAPLADPTQPPPTPALVPHLALLARAPAEAQRKGTLHGDALQALRQLRETATPDTTSFLDVHPTASVLPAELVAAVALVRGGTDLDTADLASALLAAIGRAPTANAARRVAREVLGVAVDLLGSPIDGTPVLHGLLQAVDPELGPDEEVRDATRAALGDLAKEPLRAALAARLGAVATPDLRGQLFSLLSLPLADEDVRALAPRLPRWAVQVLADTQLLREMDESTTRVERVRARLGSEEPGVLALGLAMAARLDDTRLLDPVLALAGHPRADVREGSLFALRQQTGRRVRALVLQRLTDATPDVRVEALRYAVAHRLPEVLPYLEARIVDPALETLQEPEIRALCIAFGRVARERAEPTLSELALGRRRLGHPALARYALHGLRAIGTPRARAALQHVAAEIPRLRQEVEALLAGDGR